MVGKGDYNEISFSRTMTDREASEYKTFRTSRTGCTGQGCKGRNILLQNVERRLDSICKIYSEPSAFFFIPRGSFGPSSAASARMRSVRIKHGSYEHAFSGETPPGQSRPRSRNRCQQACA